VLVNVSDHFTRVKFAKGSAMDRVIGMLFGCQTGLSIHVYDSFEMAYKREDGVLSLDVEFMKKKLSHVTANFPSYELIGWYSVGKEVIEEDFAIHRIVSEMNENPLLLMVDPDISKETKELPVKMLESVMQVRDEVTKMVFVNKEFQIDTMEPERIAIDFIVKDGGCQSMMGSSILGHLQDLHNSIRMLTIRVRVLQKFLQMSKSGEMPQNPELIREISGIARRLPIVSNKNFDKAFGKEMSDSFLVSYLAMITKAIGALHEVQGKISCMSEKQER